MGMYRADCWASYVARPPNHYFQCHNFATLFLAQLDAPKTPTRSLSHWLLPADDWRATGQAFQSPDTVTYLNDHVHIQRAFTASQTSFKHRCHQLMRCLCAMTAHGMAHWIPCCERVTPVIISQRERYRHHPQQPALPLCTPLAICRRAVCRGQPEALLKQHRPLQDFPRPDDVLASRKPYHIPSSPLRYDN